MAAEGRVYGGVSAADRTADRRRRLLEAGLELLGTRGVAAVTVGDICAEAGLTKRYFYELFDSMGTFVDAVMDVVVERLAANVFAPQHRTGQWSRDRVAGFVEALTADPRLARLLLLETFGAGGSLAGHRQALVHRAVEMLLADAHPAGTATAADEQAMRMAAYAMSGASTELLLAWLEGAFVATADELVDFLAELFARSVSLPK